MSKYVIIGNSAAAAGAVEGIRQVDKEGDITIISAESHHSYSRPLISYLLQKKTDLERMKYRPERFYDENGCDIIYKTVAKAIDPKEKSVYLSTGEKISYERLLVAAGSSPFLPPMPGYEQVKNKFSFSCLDDALALERELKPSARVLIIGAGLIGLKCAEGIFDRVGSVTVIDLAPRVLPSILDEEASELVKAHLEEKGLRFILGDSVAEFSNGMAVLKSGASCGFDILVTAVGVRANTALVKEAGGDCGRGISIDKCCKTTLPDVFAAGDCAEGTDLVSGEKKVLALLPNAYMQGHCAGINMAGGQESFETAMAMNAMGLFGLHLMTAGAYEGECFISRDGGLKKLFYKDKRLAGFIIIGDTAAAGIYTALIREKTPLESIDFDLICQKPTLMAFSKEKRAELLGGVV